MYKRPGIKMGIFSNKSDRLTFSVNKVEGLIKNLD